MYREADIRNIIKLTVAILFVLVIIGLLSLWLQYLIPSFRARMSSKARNASFVAEAGKSGLTYNAVLSSPAEAVGKPAVWCLRKISPSETLYNGEEGKSVYITNPERMYRYLGSHQNCVRMLVRISSVNAIDLGGVRAIRMEADFVDYL